MEDLTTALTPEEQARITQALVLLTQAAGRLERSGQLVPAADAPQAVAE
jgi:hypothetical protein